MYVRGREGPLLCVTVGRPEGSSRPPHLQAVRASDSLAGRAAVPGERRRDGHTRLRRRLDGARRARFLVVSVYKYDVVWTSNAASAWSNPAARPRRRRLCATPGMPHDSQPAASRAAAQRIMTQRAPQVFVLPATLCVCVAAAHPRPASRLHRRVHRRHSSSPRPKGQPPVAGTAALVARNLV